MANQPVFFITQHDLSRPIKFYPKANPPSNFVGATLTASMSAQNNGPSKFRRRTATIGSDAKGIYFQYDWQDGDTSVAGDFDFEFRATLATQKPETYPNRHYITVRIKRAL